MTSEEHFESFCTQAMRAGTTNANKSHENVAQVNTVNLVTEGAASCPTYNNEQNSNPAFIDTVNALLQQNSQMLQLLIQNQETRNQQQLKSESSNSVANFNVMPDLSKSIELFDGEQGSNVAKLWLTQLENTSVLNRWPDAFAYQTAVCNLKGAAKHWFNGRCEKINNWKDFKIAFKRTFISERSMTECWQQMQSRMQGPKENVSVYFHEKVALCRQFGLDFTEIKEQVIIGLGSRELSNFLLSAVHGDEDALYQDIIAYERICQARRDKRNDKREVPILAAGPSHPVVRQSRVNTENTKHATRLRSGATGKCFNCYDVGHYVANCPKPIRQRGSCFNCASLEHKANDCPQKSVSSTMLIQEPLDLDPPYFLRIFFPKIGVSFDSVVDSGSPISLILETYVVAEFIEPCNDKVIFLTGINNSKLQILGSYTDKVEINGTFYDMTFYVVSKNTMLCSCLLGRDFISNTNVTLKFTKNDVSLEPSTDYPEFRSNEVLLINDVNVCNKKELDINSNLSLNIVVKAHDILDSHYFNAIKPKDPKTKFRMHLTLDKHEPFYSRPRRLSYYEKTVLDNILDDLLAKGIIRESQSPYCSPIVLVKKRTGDYRMCVDYRTLNKYLVRDKFPLPLIDDHLDNLRDKKYFTKLDLKSAFYHVTLDEESRQYTSFVTPQGQFEFCKMPFGLSSSPSTFMRFINEIFRDLIRAEKVLIFLDDIMIATTSIDENLEILREVLLMLNENLLELRLDKCSFLKEKITFLGYDISGNGISPNKENLAIIDNYPIPTNIKEVHSFVGMMSYFRRFVNNFAIIAKPLYDLLKKGAKYKFGESELNAFETLKNKLISKPILSIYSPIRETELHCDGSSIGYGSILMQKQDDGRFHPVFYFSKRTTEQEAKYHSYEIECLAIVYSLKRFHVYLQGIPFKIVTDCDSFRLTLSKRDIIPRIMRWCLLLQNYDFVIEHRPNNRMRHVDALSRVQSIFVLEGNTFEQELAIKQNLDTAIVAIRNELEKSEHALYEMRNGLIYRKSGNKILFYVPKDMEANVLHTYHNNMGHVGVSKTLEIITRSYWFPYLKNKVEKHIQNCLKCIEYNPKSGRVEGFLHNIPKQNIPFDCLHIDHYGPLETTNSKNKYILAIVDGFTKFIKFYPCKTTNAKEVILHLCSYFCCYSRPRRIISDRATCFTSEAFKNFLNMQDIGHVLIATGAPKANGQIERMNRTLTPMLAKMVDERKLCWDKILDDIEFCFNNTVSRSTGQTPSMLLFGRNQLGKIDDHCRSFLESYEESVSDLADLREKAAESIESLQAKTKKYYDDRHKAASVYKVGDFVMVSNVDTTPGVNKKLIPKYRGPYEIVKILPNDRYVVNDIIGFQQTQIPYDGILDASRLKSYIKPENKNSEN